MTSPNPGRTIQTRVEAPIDPGTGRRAEIGGTWFVAGVLGAIVLLQRLALPFGGGQVPLVLPVVVAAAAWAAHRRVLEVEPVRRQLFLIALVACASATTIACWRGLPWSAMSIVFLAVTYLPFIFCLRHPTAEAYRTALSLFLGLMTVAAVIGMGQIGLQLLGVPYADPFDALPSAFVMQGYNTSYPVVYGSAIFKANGIFFLEPSFYSQFLALALVIHVYLRRRGIGAYLLVAGIVASVSGTGIILAIVSILTLALTERRRQILGLCAGAGVVAVLVAISPAGSIFTSRINESSSSTSSANGRFSAPYELSASKLSADPVTLMTGRGPGTAERTSRQVEGSTGLTAVFPVVPKVSLEYGLPALFIFLGFVLTSTLWRVPSVPLAIPLLVMYFALSGSLLQPVTVYALYALTSVFAARRGREGPERTAGRPVRIDGPSFA